MLDYSFRPAAAAAAVRRARVQLRAKVCPPSCRPPAQLPPARPPAARPPCPSAAGLLISACIGIILMIAAWVILLMRLAANYDMIRVRGAPTAKRGNKMRMFFPKHVRLSD